MYYNPTINHTYMYTHIVLVENSSRIQKRKLRLIAAVTAVNSAANRTVPEIKVVKHED